MTMVLNGPDSTVRIEVLGEELRRLREACGLTLAQVADRIGVSQGHLSKMETGKRAQGVEDVASLVTLYGVRGEERHELLALARRAGQPGLWQRQGTFESRIATLRIMESRATAMVSFEPLLVPGLLQTMPYMQAVLREVGMLEDPDKVDERVVERIHRQRVIRKVNAPKLVAIVTEAALRHHVGSREIMRDQLRFLVEVADRDNVTLRVVPTAVGGHPGLDGSFLRLRFTDRHPVVLVPNRTSSLFLEEPTEVSVYDQVTVELLSVAMSEENSVRLVAGMAATLE